MSKLQQEHNLIESENLDLILKRVLPAKTEHLPSGYWRGDLGRQRGIKAVRWLIERHLQIPIEKIPVKVNANTFKDSHLSGMFEACFASSPFQAVNAAYPNRFKPWELKSVPMNYWQGKKGREHAREAVRWLCQKYGWSRPQARRKLTRNILEENGLSGMLQQVYHNRMFKLKDDVFPEKYDLQVLRDNNQLRDVLADLYYGKKLSGEMIARRLGCSRAWVYKLMDKYGLPRRKLSKAFRNAVREGRRDFKETRRKGLTTMRIEIAQGKRKWNQPGLYKETIKRLEKGRNFKDILRSLYWDQQMSMSEIAIYLNLETKDYSCRSFQVHKGYVNRQMKKYSIPSRSISEGTKLAMYK